MRKPLFMAVPGLAFTALLGLGPLAGAAQADCIQSYTPTCGDVCSYQKCECDEHVETDYVFCMKVHSDWCESEYSEHSNDCQFEYNDCVANCGG